MIEAVAWAEDRLTMIDQTQLPDKTVYLQLNTIEDIFDAIQKLKVRGAPAIGITAAYGLYFGMRNLPIISKEDFFEKLQQKINYLSAARPTAVNLFWALESIRTQLESLSHSTIADLKAGLLKFAIALHEDDYRTASIDLQNAISEGYTTYNAYLSYVIVLQSDKNYSASLAVIDEALKMFPDRKELYIYRVEALSKSGDRDGALEELVYILDAYPRNAELVDMAGRIASEDKKYTTALKYFNQKIPELSGSLDKLWNDFAGDCKQ